MTPSPTTPTSKRPRGRPPTPQGAKPQAEIQRAYRERLKANRIPPADVADLHERLGRLALTLELREQDVARLTARNTVLENELKRVEQHNLNLLKDNIVLKQAAAAPAVRTRARPRTK
jgi:hypothetical protein